MVYSILCMCGVHRFIVHVLCWLALPGVSGWGPKRILLWRLVVGAQRGFYCGGWWLGPKEDFTVHTI